MKILVIYSQTWTDLAQIESLKKGLESNGHQVTIKTTADRGEMISCFPYDLLVVGSPIFGLRGKIAEDLPPFLNTIKRMEGQVAMAFVKHKLLGTDKALRQLMNQMEAQGCIVKDFSDFKSSQDAYKFGAQIK